MPKFEFQKDRTLFLIDISSFIFRAFYAVRRLNNSKGEPTNAVFGVASMLLRLKEEVAPHFGAVIYDSKEPSFRKDLYADYKANRSEPPEDLIPQFDRIESMVSALKIPGFRISRVEADDIIATLTKKWTDEDPKNEVIIVSGDKDLMQLVNDRVRVWDTMKDVVYNEAAVTEKFGVTPSQIQDYLAIVGDSSDNIPGVPGVGPKTAVMLLKEWGEWSEILKAAQSGKIKGSKGEAIAASSESFKLSHKLVELDQNVKIKNGDSLLFHFEWTDEAETLFNTLEFGSMKARFKGSDGLAVSVESGRKNRDEFKTIWTEKELNYLLEQIDKKKEFGFDTETTSLNPRQAALVGMSFCVDTDEAFYLPIAHRDTARQQLTLGYVREKTKPFLEDNRYKKIGQNLKFDWNILAYQGFLPSGIGADTMVAAYVLDPSGRHGMDFLSKKYLDYTPISFEEVCGSGKNQITFDQVPVEKATQYSAEDAWVTLKLWQELLPKLKQEHLLKIFSEIDLPLVEMLARMEQAGVKLDLAWFKKISFEMGKEIDTIEQRVKSYTVKPINLNSPKQLQDFLFQDLKLPPQGKIKTGFSTDSDVLEALSPLHEVPRLLLQYRELSKLKGTYVDPIPQMVDSKTGRLHGSFHQTVAATGRLSSSDPNLQNIPIRTEKGRLIRRGFVAESGSIFLSADYSQIELRILAHMSGDQDLIDSFQKDEDIHSRTASEIFGKDPGSISDNERGVAKAINFGLMYGKTAFGLAQELKISRGKAKEMIDRYFSRYHKVKTYLDSLITSAKEAGYTETLLGRKRPLPEIHSQNGMVRANAERMAMNTPIQGTASDLIKIAMVRVDEALSTKKLKSKIVIQVHDELLLECPKEEIEKVSHLVRQEMESALNLKVPLKVNLSIGPNWDEMS